MAAELITGLGIFKSMLDSAKALKDINDRAIRNAAVIELQEKILSAREQQTALTERIRELERRVADFETWNTEKQRYELVDIGSGTFAYTVKAAMRGTEPPHYICTNCYQNGKAAILQHAQMNMGHVLTCPSCKTKSLTADGAYRPPQ